MKTIDEVTTISNYYEKLAAFNGWELGSSGIATDMSGAWLNIEQDDFTASIQMSRASKTTSIELSIHYTSELINSKTQALPLSEHPTPAPTSDSSGAISTETEGDYIFSESDKKLLEKSELLSLGDWQLKVARNEIYARHGREFVHKDLQCYFATKGWYKVDSSYSTGDLSNLENKNVALILNYEKEKGSSLLATDSGCKN